MATHSNILAWRIPWTEEPGRLQSMGSQRVRHDLVTEQQQYTYVDRHRLIPPAVAGPSFGGSRVLVYFHGCVQSLSHVQLFVTPMDYSLPDSSVRGISQARILEWVAIPFSRGSSWPGIKPKSPALQVDSYHACHQGIISQFFILVVGLRVCIIARENIYYLFKKRDNLSIF